MANYAEEFRIFSKVLARRFKDPKFKDLATPIKVALVDLNGAIMDISSMEAKDSQCGVKLMNLVNQTNHLVDRLIRDAKQLKPLNLPPIPQCMFVFKTAIRQADFTQRICRDCLPTARTFPIFGEPNPPSTGVPRAFTEPATAN